MRTGLLTAVSVALFTSGAASAGAAPFLEGRFYLDMVESKWGPGVNGAPPAPAGAPQSGGSHITGAIWFFDKDDGKHREGWLMQTLHGGRRQFFYYDFNYDGKLHWLNDWYLESNEKLDESSFRVGWEVRKDGMKEPLKGGPAICRISRDRTRLDCDAAGLHEVYSKTAAPPKVE
jgi:hypothetical protein